MTYGYRNLLPNRKIKWNKQENQVPGTVCLLRQDSMRVCKWWLGVITTVFFSSDGLVRNCDLWVSTGKVIRRAVQTLCILWTPGQEQEEEF